MVHDEFDDLGHLGVDAFHGPGVGVGHAVPAGHVVDGEAAVPEVAARPGQGVDAPAVETVVDEFREVFAASAVAAGQGEGRQQLAEAGQGRVGVQGVDVGLLLDAVVGGGRDAGLERRRCLRDRVAERDDLPAATDGADVLGQSGGAGVDEQDGVEAHLVGECRHLVGRGQPDRGEHAAQVRGGLVQAGGGGPVGAQQAPEVVGLLGPVDDADLPGLGEQPGEELPGGRGVRLVDQAEVGLEPVENLRVGVQEGLVAAEHGLEHGLPPGEFELVGDVSLGHVALGQVGHQRVEIVFAQGSEQRGALM